MQILTITNPQHPQKLTSYPFIDSLNSIIDPLNSIN